MVGNLPEGTTVFASGAEALRGRLDEEVRNAFLTCLHLPSPLHPLLDIRSFNEKWHVVKTSGRRPRVKT